MSVCMCCIGIALQAGIFTKRCLQLSCYTVYLLARATNYKLNDEYYAK